MIDKEAESAKDLVIAAIIIQILFIAIYFIFLLISGSIFAIALALFFGILWVFLDYTLILQPIEENKIENAESPSLILGILQLIFGGIIPGILILLAHGKISSSIIFRLKESGSTHQL